MSKTGTTTQQLQGYRSRELREIHKKIDRLDEAIRGNGHIGILRRLDRLELVEGNRRRFNWVVISAFTAAGASAVVQLVSLLWGK